MTKVIAIFCEGQAGDAATISSVLYYKEELWGKDCKVIWYIGKQNMDLLKHSDIEVREFPRGFGYPKMVEEENVKLIAEGKEPVWRDWSELVDWKNHMNIALKYKYPELAEIDLGFFPAPHQMTPQQRHGIEYPNISKQVFDVPDRYEWHPVLNFSQDERATVKEMMDNLPFEKTCAIESMAGSGQSKITHEMIRQTMKMCWDKFGYCNFIFVSHKYLNGNETFPDEFKNARGIYFASVFTVRQCALIIAKCDLLISVSSGVTVAASCWENKDAKFKVLQFCGSLICSTAGLSEGRDFTLVTHDEKPFEQAKDEYYTALTKILKQL